MSAVASDTIEMATSDNPTLLKSTTDPTLFASAYKKNRFYLLSRRHPDEGKGLVQYMVQSDFLLPLTYLSGGHFYIQTAFHVRFNCRGESERDVFNEKPSKEEQMAVAKGTSGSVVTDVAVLHTTFGDIHIKLFPER